MKTLSYLLVMLFLLVNVSFSQTVDEVISNYFENTGGLDNWKSLKSVKISGKVPTPQGEFEFTIYKKAPNLLLTEMDIQGNRLVPQAYDGSVAWMINPFTGSTEPQKLPEEASKELVDEAIFEDPFIDYASKGHEVTLEGKEQLGGTECYVIKMVKNKNNDKDDIPVVYYIDTEYYLPIMMKSYVLTGPSAGQEVETYMSNYEEVDSVFVMPFSLEMKVAGQTQQVVTVEKIEINPEISDDFFKFTGSSGEEEEKTEE